MLSNHDILILISKAPDENKPTEEMRRSLNGLMACL